MRRKIFPSNMLPLVSCLAFIILLYTGKSAFGAIDPPISVDLQAASDSGSYDNDDLTNLSTPTIDIIAAREGDTVNVYREGTLLGQAALVDGVSYQYTFTDGALSEGNNVITARSFDGVEESTDSPSIEIVLDVSGPQIVTREPRDPVNVLTVVLNSVKVVFSEAINFDPGGGGSFTVDDVTITGPDGTITPTGITSVGGNEYDILFDPQTSLGIYTVSVGPGIVDLAGNAMDQDQDGQPGEAEDDIVTFSFIVDEGERSFWEGFESPDSGWEIDNGVWEIGAPTSGPGSVHEGTSVAGTYLGDYYPDNTDSRLISPEMNLPAITGDDGLELRFLQWYAYYSGDYGEVQISTWNGSVWSEWEALATPAPADSRSDWSRINVDLTPYASQRVRIAFYHTSDSTANWLGWYIDVVEIWHGVPSMPALEGFEGGWGDWTTDSGVWQVGEPTSGPSSAYQGTMVAGTDLSDNYPHYSDSRLISPALNLPTVAGDEHIELRFWQWYSYNNYAYGEVQISTWDGSAWSDWATLATPAPGNSRSDWSRINVDLTPYAGQRLRIAFYHTSSSTSDREGWYLDAIEIWQGMPGLPALEGFESGFGSWSTDSGVWQVGEPTSGPTSAYQGTMVAGTDLSTNYPYNTDSRLITPEINLPSVTGQEHLELRFWQWYSYGSDAYGEVQISTWDGSVWSDWTTLVTPAPEYSQSGWSRVNVDLTPYSGQHVRIAFYHTSGSSANREGWYIDAVEIWQGEPSMSALEGFESGWGDWTTDFGIWQVGEPTSGPSSAYQGTMVAGTNLSGDYPDLTDSRIISPDVYLPTVTGDEHLELRFWQWYYYHSGAYGEVQVSAWDGSVWSDWTTLATPAPEGSQSDWSRVNVELTPYAGQRVRVAFFHQASRNNREGWYIDAVEIWQGVPSMPALEGFEGGWGDWTTDSGVWQVGEPTYGPSSAYQGTMVAGTNLSGNYPYHTDSRFISPEVNLPTASGDEHLELRFWQWYTYYHGDFGEVQVSTWNGSAWSDWEALATPAPGDSQSGWSRINVDLTPYAGQRVRIAFYHTDDANNTSAGWYIDAVEIWQGVPNMQPLEGFEGGFGDWSTDFGVWQVGEPTSGPSSAYLGIMVAGADLSANYPYGTDGRLISPEVSLPTVNIDERLQLRFHQWYAYDANAYGQVQVSIRNGSSWSDWETLATPAPEENQSGWSKINVDLTPYEGQLVRIAFYHQASYSYHGKWYIDEVQVWQGLPSMPAFEGFEGGWGDWSTDTGVWQVGEPAYGPSSAFQGIMVAGTNLSSDYPDKTDSRLISPEIILPGVGGDEFLTLRFWQWYSYNTHAYGDVQVSAWDGSSWSDWKTLTTPAPEDSQSSWSMANVDLTPYAGKRARIAFYHINLNVFNREGWYIDDVELSHFIPNTLSMGENLGDSFTNDSERNYYVVKVPPGGHLRLTLDDLDDSGINEVYLRHGALPSAGEYNYRFSNQGGADQEIFIPNATPGDWYILIIAQSVGNNGDYTLRTDFSAGIFVTGVTPKSAGNSAPATITIDGAGFEPASEVTLVQGGTTILANEVTYISAARLLATIDLTGLSAGNYQLGVQSGAGSDEIPFEVMEGGSPSFEANLTVPSSIGYRAPATIWVEYANTGEVAMLAPLLIVTAEQNGEKGAYMRLGTSVLPSSIWTSAPPQGYSESVQILATGDAPGVLQPGESYRVPIQYVGWKTPWDMSRPPIIFKLGVLDTDNDAIVDWVSLKEQLRPESITEEIWEPIWDNFVGQAGATWGDYVKMLTDNAIYFGKLDQRITDISELVAFEFAQADALNVVRQLAASVDAYVPTPGLDLSFRRIFQQSISRRYRLGAFGRGWTHNWNVSLSVATDGTITISEPNGARRIFQPDSRPEGGYFAVVGDYATLTNLGGGAFKLHESNGFLRAFRSDGKLDYVEDTNGNRITVNYTGELLTSLSHSVGQTIQITYNAAGLIEAITDPDNRQTTFAYDAAYEHLVSSTYFDGSNVTYDYNTNSGITRRHALTEIQYPENRHQYFIYDGRGRLASVSRDGGAEAFSFSYDSAGMVAAADAFNNINRYYLDHKGLLMKVTDPQGNSVALDYDENFNLIKITDPIGRAYNYDYDNKGNLIYVTDPLGNSTRFGFTGPFNRLTRFMDAKGNVTDYGYDTRGNLTSITYDDSSVETWGYDTQGNPTSWTNRRNNTISYEYDASGRITAKIYPDASRVDYTYDSRGNLDSAADALGTTTLEYDVDDRLERITYPGGRFLEYTYNTAGQRASMLNQLGHRLDYHFDSVGRLERITDERATEIVHYYYDAAGRLERKVLGNGVYTIYEYDIAGQLTSLTNYKPDATILSRFVYAYDSRGRRISMTTAYGGSDPRIFGTWDYEYDDIGQLTAWTAPDGRRVEYLYDALGNRITVTENGVVTVYTTNNINQYTQVGDTTYNFDADGNLISRISLEGTTILTFNDENRLVAVASPDGKWAYTYDAFGNRVRVDDNGAVTDFVIDPIGFGYVVGEYNHSTGSLKTIYDHGFGLLSSMNTEDHFTFFSFDGNGSTSELTKRDVSLVETFNLSPFGDKISNSNNSSYQHVYAGEFGVLVEKNGLHFVRARFYDSVLGRFTSMDPIGLAGRDMNFYRYVDNNPVKYVDPTGLSSRVRTVRKKGRQYFNGRELQDLDRLMRERDVIWDENQHPNYHDLPEYKHFDNLDRAFKDPTGPLPDFDIDFKNGEIKIKPKGIDDLVEWMLNEVSYYEVELPSIWDLEFWVEVLREIVGGFDPNGKIGPGGYGEQSLIAGDTLLPYRVSFENWEQATAPAQIVTVTDQLDADLDWSTFELTEIGFGDERIAMPSDTQHYETTVPMSYNGVDFEVQVEAGIHLTTGKVYANFYSIDPLTGLPPTVDIGFLPPEDGTGRGQGYFAYTIRPKKSLPEGTEIRNVALITFDFQETIATNQVDPHDSSQGTDPDKECLNTIAPDEVNLMTASTGGGSVTVPGEGTFTYDWGGTVNLIAAPDDGAMFVNWTGDVNTISDIYAAETTVTMYDNFAITATFATEIPVYLKKGYNLIAITADVASHPDLKDWLPLLGDSTEIEKVMAYDDSAGKYITLIPEDPLNPSFILKGGEGLIVYARVDKEITFTSLFCASHDLKPGNNLVGFACPSDGYSAFDVMYELQSTNVSSIQRYSTEKGAFESAGFDQSGQLSGIDFPIVPGEGYYIFMK